jgi:hypothetical protein
VQLDPLKGSDPTRLIPVKVIKSRRVYVLLYLSGR